MSQTIDVNGQSINYPETGDTNWGDEATDFAVQTSAAFGKLGLASGTSVDIAQTLDVTGNTTLDANLSVAGTTSLTGNVTLTNNLTVNGNTSLGNASGDTTTVTGIVNVDSGVLYVDPVNNRVGINDTTPSQALDVTGNALISGTLEVTGATTLSSTLGVTGDVAINTNKFNITAASGNTAIAGTLGVTGDVSVNTNKFNVTASSGNTTIAGTLGISNGTALAPAITPSGDTNTGLYSIGADKFGFSANGTRVGEFGSGYGGFVGNIIQVVSTTKKDTQIITTTNWGTEITGLSVTITPKYSSSLIYLSTQINSSVSGSIIVFYRLYRNSTLILVGDAAGSRDQVSFAQYPASYASSNILSTGIIGVDSPSATSAITYSVQCRSTAGTVYVNRTDTDINTSGYPRAISTITAMEIQQ